LKLQYAPPYCGGSFILTGLFHILNWAGCIMTKCEGLISLCITCKIIWEENCDIFCNITPCSWVKDNWRFGRLCRLYLQGWSVSQARSHHEASCCMLRGGLVFGLLVNPKGGYDMFYRNVQRPNVERIYDKIFILPHWPFHALDGVLRNRFLFIYSSLLYWWVQKSEMGDKMWNTSRCINYVFTTKF
jgi:hypothetical protein